MPLKSWWKFIYLGVVWGATFLWLRIALDELGPLTLNAIRLTIAPITLIVICRLTRSTWPGRKFLPAMAFLGIFNIALPFALITWSELYITTGLASILNSTVPLFTILLVLIFVPSDRFSLTRGAGLALGFGGVVLLMLDKVGNGVSAVAWGAGVMLLASLSYAIAAVYARRKMPDASPAMVAFGQSIFASLALWTLALIFESPIRLPHLPVTWVALVWLGTAATGGGTTLYFYLLREVGPTRTTLTTYIYPLVGVLLGWIFLSEQPDWRLAVGGLLVISGVALVNARTTRPKQVVPEMDNAA